MAKTKEKILRCTAMITDHCKSRNGVRLKGEGISTSTGICSYCFQETDEGIARRREASARQFIRKKTLTIYCQNCGAACKGKRTKERKVCSRCEKKTPEYLKWRNEESLRRYYERRRAQGLPKRKRSKVEPKTDVERSQHKRTRINWDLSRANSKK